MNSKEYYDEIAQNYSDFLTQNEQYLLAIEKQITCNTNVNNFLDIGCGDGTRSKRLINALRPKFSTLIDESEEMVKIASETMEKTVVVLNENFLDFHLTKTFNLITCLWNVFGHLPDRRIRFEFLKKIYSLLEEGGFAYIDVNNRYNIRTYGMSNVMKSIVKDKILKDKTSGYWKLKLPNKKESEVYIHNPNELDVLIKKAGFEQIEKSYFDYKTGAKVDSYWKGQILYRLKK